VNLYRLTGLETKLDDFFSLSSAEPEQRPC
jgi:hypothetical protein